MTRAQQAIKAVDWNGWAKAIVPLVVLLIVGYTQVVQAISKVEASEKVIAKQDAAIAELQRGIQEMRVAQATSNRHLAEIERILAKLDW